MEQRTTGRQRAPMTTRGLGGGEVEHLVSVLRSAGAWLRLAADELEAEDTSLTRAAGEASDFDDQPMASAYLVGDGDVHGSFEVLKRSPGATFEAALQVTPGMTTVDQLTTTSCGCADTFGLQEAHHRWLLSIEDDGFIGALGLVRYLTADEEVERDPGLLRWFELEEFVAQHNWRDPQAMYEMAQLLTLLLRARSEEWTRTEREMAR